MADDTAALVLSLEARFDKFEKAMADATKVVDRSTKAIENRFAAMTDVISQKLSGIQAGLTGRLGFVGDLLGSLGKGGTAAAVGVGLLAVAFKLAADAVIEFGGKMVALRNLSITTGLSTDALQALRKAAKDMAVDFDVVGPAIEKFVRNWESLRQGTGEVRTQLLRINPALEAQLAAAKDETEAVDLLARAFRGLSASQAQLLGRAAFGRADTDVIRLFIKGIDLNELQAKMRAANKIIDKAMVEDTADTFDKFKANTKSAGAAYVNLVGTAMIPVLKLFNSTLESALQKLDEFTSKSRQAVDVPGALRITVSGRRPEPELPRETPIDVLAARSRERISFLGDAATATEKYKNQLLQLSAAVAENKNLAPDLKRAQNAVTEARERDMVATKQQLGIATEQELNQQAMILLYKQLSDATGQLTVSERQFAEAQALIIKRNRETVESQRVALSEFPQLTRMMQDLTNVNKQLDQFAATSINTFVDSMADAITGAKSFGEAFKDMANSILKDIARIAIRQAIIKPLMSSFGIAGLMAGGPAMAGTPYIVGERGPELFIPQGSGTVIPNNKLGNFAIGAPTTNVTVQGGADRDTIAAMRAMFAERDRRFVGDVKAATVELRRRSMLR